MSLSDLYNYNYSTPAQIDREAYNNVGASNFQLGVTKRAFYGGADFEIWDSAVGGTQLTENVDYTLEEEDTFYTTETGSSVYTAVNVSNALYQSGNIYITYKCIGSYTDKDVLEIFTPVGGILSYCGNTVPTGFFECDGSAISRVTYNSLFAVIGCRYGKGDGSTTFNIPDYRGTFLRGWDNSAGSDPDASSRTTPFTQWFDTTCDTVLGVDVIDCDDTANMTLDMEVSGVGIPANSYITQIISTTQFRISNNATANGTNVNLGFQLVGDYVGTEQTDEVGPHLHSMSWYAASNKGIGADASWVLWSITPAGSRNTNNSTGSESRPINAYVMYIIKY